MTEKLFEMIKANSAKELMEEQQNRSVKAAKEDVLRTLVAIKILNEHYKEKQALWKLVEKKARDFCKKNLKVSDQALDTIID